MAKNAPKKRKKPVRSPHKDRGCVKLSYEHLAALMGLKVLSVRSVTADPLCECVHIVHDDNSWAHTYTLGEGQHMPTNTPHIDYWNKRVAELLKRQGWKVEPPDAEVVDTIRYSEQAS